MHFIPTKPNHLSSRIASCLVTLARISLATSDSRSTQLLTERYFPQPISRRHRREHERSRSRARIPLAQESHHRSSQGLKRPPVKAIPSCTRVACLLTIWQITPAASTLKLQRQIPEIRFGGPQEPRQEAQLRRYII